MIKYSVNSEDNVTTATITKCSEDVLKKLENIFGYKITDKRMVKAALISEEFSGKSKCHPEDTFDENIGKDIARKRMMEKYHQARIKAFNRVDKLLDDKATAIMMAIQHEIKTCKKHA